MNRILITFQSSRAAIKADLLCDTHSIGRRIIATPEYITSECGMSLEVEEEFVEQLCLLLDKNSIQYKKHD